MVLSLSIGLGVGLAGGGDSSSNSPQPSPPALSPLQPGEMLLVTTELKLPLSESIATHTTGTITSEYLLENISSAMEEIIKNNGTNAEVLNITERSQNAPQNAFATSVVSYGAPCAPFTTLPDARFSRTKTRRTAQRITRT